jgi:hypothetical protein
MVPVRVLHKDEKILGWKHIYLPHAQTAIYDSKVKLFLKRGISHQLGRDESVLKNIFKSGYEEIRDRKLLEILKKERTLLQIRITL